MGQFEYFNPVPLLKKYDSFEQLLSKQDREEIDNLCKDVREMWASDSLKPYERLVGAFMGLEIDRVPNGTCPPFFKTTLELGKTFRDFYTDPVTSVKANLLAIKKYQLDVGVAFVAFDQQQSTQFGTKWAFPDNSLPKVTDWALKKDDFSEILDNDLPDPRESQLLKWDIEAGRFLNKKLGDLQSFSLIMVLGPYYQYCSQLRGVKAFYDIKKNPERALKAFDKLCDYTVGLVKYALKEMNSPVWTLVESLVSPSFTPPAWYQKFCKPYQKRLLEEISAPCTIAGGGQGHTDFTPLLEEFANLGFVGFQFGPPTDLRKMRKISDETPIYIWDWAITSPVMRFETPRFIDKQVKEALKIGKGGKYILGTDVPDHDTPDENMFAIRNALLKYGKY